MQTSFRDSPILDLVFLEFRQIWDFSSTDWLILIDYLHYSLHYDVCLSAGRNFVLHLFRQTWSQDNTNDCKRYLNHLVGNYCALAHHRLWRNDDPINGGTHPYRHKSWIGQYAGNRLRCRNIIAKNSRLPNGPHFTINCIGCAYHLHVEFLFARKFHFKCFLLSIIISWLIYW